MRETSKCQVCNELTDSKVCPQCESHNLVTVYQCDHCKKSFFWRGSEKDCCHAIKEAKKKGKERQ